MAVPKNMLTRAFASPAAPTALSPGAEPTKTKISRLGPATADQIVSEDAVGWAKTRPKNNHLQRNTPVFS